MVYGLPAYGETGWHAKLNASVDAVKATADAALPAAQKGAASGVAPLGADSRVPEANLPANLSATTLADTFVTQGTLSVALSDYASLKVGSDWAPALAAAIADLPVPNGTTSMSGGEIRLPAGTVQLGSRVTFDRAVRLVADGPFTTTLTPAAGFTDTSLLRWTRHASVTLTPGASARDVLIDMAGVNAHAIEVYRGYDNVLFENVRVVNVAGGRSAFRFERDPADLSWNISQSILMENCYAAGADTTGTEALYVFDRAQEVTLVNCKGLGSGTGAISTRPVFSLLNCNGVAFIGCAVGFASNAWKIVADGQTSSGFAIYGATVETTNVWLSCSGVAGGVVSNLSADRPRVEGGSGGASVTQTTDCHIDFPGLVVGTGSSRVWHPGVESVFFPAFAMQAYFGAPTLGSVGIVPAWLLDAAGTEGVQGGLVRIPDHWGTFKVSLVWSNAGAGAGDIVLVALRGVVQPGVDLNAGPLVSGSWVLTAPPQEDLKVDLLTTGVTNTAGSYASYRLYRDGGNASDTLANDCAIIGFLLERES